MTRNWIKYLTVLFASALPIVTMEEKGISGAPAQPISGSSEGSLRESLADPVQWNTWLAHLVNQYFKEPYQDSNRTAEKKINGQDYVVNRPNHALAHGMRQGFLAVGILDGLEQVNAEDFTSAGTADFIRWVQVKLKTDPHFRQKVQVTASFQRTGRKSEEDISTRPDLVQAYEFQDSENFYKDLKPFVGPDNLFMDDNELKLFKQSILKNSKLKYEPFPPATKDLQYLRRIIWTSHTLDLRRLVKTEFNEPTVIANATKSLFGPETAFSDPEFRSSQIYPQFKAEAYFINKLWGDSGHYLEATGDRYDGKFEDQFFLQANHPDQMVTALVRTRDRLKSKPHDMGIFLYSACPLEMQNTISVKQKTGPIKSIAPQPSYQWCVLLKQRKDKTYSIPGGMVSSFEDETHSAQKRVRAESGGLYDIDPTTFDKGFSVPLDKSQPLSEFKHRSLNRLQNETPEQHKDRLASMAAPETIARHDARSAEGETLQEFKIRQVFENPPLKVQSKKDGQVNFTMFFKEVPFHEAGSIKETVGSHEGEEYVWAPVQKLGSFKLHEPFRVLLEQEETKTYLKDKILPKPLPMATIHKMKANIEIKDRNNKSGLARNPDKSFTMFDKYAKTFLGEETKDTETSLGKIVAKHNEHVNEMLQLIDKYPPRAADYVFYNITVDIQKKLLQMANKEGQSYPWFVFYHAVPAGVYQVYQIFREFRSLMAGKSLKDNLVLRGMDDPFSLIQNIEDFYQKAQEQYNQGGAQTLDKTDMFRKQGLSVNMTLFGGLEGALDSGHLKAEYSVHRWLAGYSDIDNPNFAQGVISHLLTNMGIPKERAKRYQALYEEYFTPSQPLDWKNTENIKDVMQHTDKRQYGVMIQLFVNPDIINEVAYISVLGGRKINEAAKTVLEAMRSPSQTSDNFQGAQTRLFLKPEYFYNPEYVKTFSYFSKDLEKPEKEYQEKLKKLVAEDVAFLLSDNTPAPKESLKENHALLDLHERVTGNIRQQTDVPDQKVVDWFAAKQTDEIRAYYEKNPTKVNAPLKKIHLLSYGDEEIKIPENGCMPIQLSLIYKNQDLFLYFLDKLDFQSQESFLSSLIPVPRHEYAMQHMTPLEALGYTKFQMEDVLPKLYEKLGNILFDELFLAEDIASASTIMKIFEKQGIPQHYLENIFSKPAYLRGIKWINKISLDPEKAKFVLNTAFESLWLAFKEMPFWTGKDLSPEEQRYYNILFKGQEPNYKPMAKLFVLNKFPLSYFETFLGAIHFDRFNPKNSFAIFHHQFGDNFFPDSTRRFFDMVKVNLPKKEPKRIWETPVDPFFELMNEYQSTKKKSLDGNDAAAFDIFMTWLEKFWK